MCVRWERWECLPDGRPTGSNLFHQSRGSLAAVRTLFTLRMERNWLFRHQTLFGFTDFLNTCNRPDLFSPICYRLVERIRLLPQVQS